MGASLSGPSFKAVLPSEVPSTAKKSSSSSKAAAKAQQYTREELKLMRALLPSFVFLEKSNDMHRQLAGVHWDRVFKVAQPSKGSQSSQREGLKAPEQPQKSKLLELYDEFFACIEAESPELRPIFRQSMQIRGKVLVHISIGMRTLMASDKFVEKVLPLVKTHRRFGVKLEHYEPLGKALIHAMRVVSGPDEWTPEVEDAWRRLFSHTSVILMRAQKRVDALVTKEAAKPIAPRRRASMLARISWREKGAAMVRKRSAVLPSVADLIPHVILGRRDSAPGELMGPSRRMSVGGYDTDIGSRHVAAGMSSVVDGF